MRIYKAQKIKSFVKSRVYQTIHRFIVYKLRWESMNPADCLLFREVSICSSCRIWFGDTLNMTTFRSLEITSPVGKNAWKWHLEKNSIMYVISLRRACAFPVTSFSFVKNFDFNWKISFYFAKTCVLAPRKKAWKWHLEKN